MHQCSLKLKRNVPEIMAAVLLCQVNWASDLLDGSINFFS